MVSAPLCNRCRAALLLPSMPARHDRYALVHQKILDVREIRRRIDAHDVSSALDALERAVTAGRFDESRLAQLEFLYLPALGHFTREPRTLHRAMANHLIASWKTPPGSEEGGSDATKMNEWVDRARAELRESGREEIGDQLIGQVMSGSPSDTDHAWPLIPIRELIERLGSDDFETGLRIGKYNARGVITRSPVGGGDLERGEAEMYDRMADTTKRWPRTSAMLRSMAAQARAHATHGRDTSSSPVGCCVSEPKSAPIPTWSMPATFRM